VIPVAWRIPVARTLAAIASPLGPVTPGLLTLSVIAQLASAFSHIGAVAIKLSLLLLGNNAVAAGVFAIFFEFAAVFAVILTILPVLSARLCRRDDR